MASAYIALSNCMSTEPKHFTLQTFTHLYIYADTHTQTACYDLQPAAVIDFTH